eukprot:3837198-Amphidinium_carterae.1
MHGQSFILRRPSRADVKDASHSASDSCKTAPAHHQRPTERGKEEHCRSHTPVSFRALKEGGGSCAMILTSLVWGGLSDA